MDLQPAADPYNVVWTPLLRRLHWLPIRKRIEFKILVIVSIPKLPTIWAISFHFASQLMPLAHHMTVHFFPFQELGHVRQIMRFKSLVHVCGILFQPTWDRPNHWTFSRVNLKLTCSINGFAYVRQDHISNHRGRHLLPKNWGLILKFTLPKFQR